MAPLRKKHKVYLVALAVSGCVWAADRVFSPSPLTGPAEAAASLVVTAAERSIPPSAGRNSVAGPWPSSCAWPRKRSTGTVP